MCAEQTALHRYITFMTFQSNPISSILSSVQNTTSTTLHNISACATKMQNTDNTSSFWVNELRLCQATEDDVPSEA